MKCLFCAVAMFVLFLPEVRADETIEWSGRYTVATKLDLRRSFWWEANGKGHHIRQDNAVLWCGMAHTWTLVVKDVRSVSMSTFLSFSDVQLACEQARSDLLRCRYAENTEYARTEMQVAIRSNNVALTTEFSALNTYPRGQRARCIYTGSGHRL